MELLSESTMTSTPIGNDRIVKNKRFPICFAIVGIVNGINGKSAFAKSVIEELSFRETTRVNHLGRPVAVYAAKMLEIMFPP